MRCCMIGYGKMGKAIEQILLKRGHSISGKITSSNHQNLAHELQNSDVAIEFSAPEFAVPNIISCFKNQVPVICGTTGWLKDLEYVNQMASEFKGSLLYASNFSIGVNLFFELNERLAQIIGNFNEYKVSIEEIHHIHKKDHPSGTALSLVNGIIKHHPIYKQWTLGQADLPGEIPIHSRREGEVIGTHIIEYSSEIDKIEIKHEAFNRQGFALGAVLASEWLYGKLGVFTMKDFLKIV